MLFHINTMLAGFYWRFYAHDVQIPLPKHLQHLLAPHCDTNSTTSPSEIGTSLLLWGFLQTGKVLKRLIKAKILICEAIKKFSST